METGVIVRARYRETPALYAGVFTGPDARLPERAVLGTNLVNARASLSWSLALGICTGAADNLHARIFPLGENKQAS